MKPNFLLFLLLNCFATTISLAQGSWTTVPNAPTPMTRIDDICFSNDTTALFSQNSIVYRSTDKGNIWAQIGMIDSGGSYVRSIEFLNSDTGFAGILSSAFPINNILYKTTDGGFTWWVLTNMQTQPDDGICGMAHYGNRLVAVGTYAGPAWFYRTDDLGASWTKVDLSSMADGLVDCYMFSEDTILVTGKADAAHQYAATILKSVDGGLTWTRIFLSSEPYTYGWKIFMRPTGIGLMSVESTNLYHTIARTVDFGNTWTEIFVDSTSINNDLGGIGMLNDTLGWVSSQCCHKIFETQDGGLTWSYLTSPVIKGDRMVAADSVSMLAVGQTVYRYQYGPVGIAEPQPDKPIHSLTIYPNPANDFITIVAHAGTSTFGFLDLIDAKGNRIQRIARQHFVKGENTFRVDIRKYNAGNYKVVWHSNEQMISGQLAIIR